MAYSYDNLGRTAAKTLTVGGRTYETGYSYLPGTTATFDYNADGLRIRKTVNGIETNYTLHGKKIVHMTQGANDLHFWYDAQNRPAIVQFNGEKYGYVVNLQGDIVSIIDNTGTEVVKYVYDAWGKILSTTGSLASTLGTIQPFRYRGYVYDPDVAYYEPYEIQA